jgi:Flp pilus assembly protein TadD
MTDDSPRRPAGAPIASGAATQRDFEIEFLEAVLRRNPRLVDAVRVHAQNLAAAGQVARALHWDLRHARLRPDDPVPHYNVACMLARLGEIDDAFEALERAIDRGYPLMRRVLRDPDLKPLRRDPRYPALVRRLVRGRSD